MNILNRIFLPEKLNEWGGYKNIRDDKKYDEYRDYLENMWQLYCPYADKQFKKELQKTEASFHQRIWELYLGSKLIESNHKLESKLKDSGPDLCIPRRKNKIWIELVCPEKGNNKSNAVPTEQFKPEVYNGNTLLTASWTNLDRQQQIKLRYLSIIRDKNEIIKKYLSNKIINSNDPVIIAVNSAMIEPTPSGNSDMPIILGLCYGYGDLQTIIKGKKITDSFMNEIMINKISEHNVKTQVESAIFLRNIYPHISAIFFSYFKFGHSSTSLRKDILIHNPFAENPLTRKFIKLPIKEYWLSYIKYDQYNASIINSKFRYFEHLD